MMVIIITIIIIIIIYLLFIVVSLFTNYNISLQNHYYVIVG